MSSNCTYGTAELEKLLKFYGEITEIEYEGNIFSTPADVDKTETRHEWKAFNLVIFEEKSLSLKELAILFLGSEAKCVTFPNSKILLTIAMVLPVSTATVERSFSNKKQIKDRLRNRLLPASMFMLVIIAIEGPPLHEVDFDAVLALSKAMKLRRLLIKSEQSFNNNCCYCIMCNQSFIPFLYKMHLDIHGYNTFSLAEFTQ